MPASSDRLVRSTEPRPEIWFHRKVRLGRSVRELWGFRELIITLAERDLRVRYKQAVLGIAWAVITPVAMTIAFSVIFTKIGHVNAHSHGVPYPLFAYMGLLPWTFFSTCVTAAGLSLVNSIPLLNKLYCPREVFPIAAMLDAALDALIASTVLLLLFPIFGVAPKIQTVYVPLLLVVLVAFSLGVTLAVSVVVVFMRDLRLVLPLIVQFGLFVTPVIYSPQTLLKSESVLVTYSFFNPLVPVLDGLRRCMLYGQAPNWPALAAGAAGSLVVLTGGFILFKRLELRIADVA
jgi:ABC-2 type transport system permease protein/lipopolysaccharide transport system permease protein